MDRVAEIRRRLEKALSPEKLEIDDESRFHIGHAGAAGGAGHFRVRLSAVSLAGLGRVARQRAVYAAVGDMMGPEIHALAVEFI